MRGSMCRRGCGTSGSRQSVAVVVTCWRVCFLFYPIPTFERALRFGVKDVADCYCSTIRIQRHDPDHGGGRKTGQGYFTLSWTSCRLYGT